MQNEIMLKTIQDIELDILIKFAEFCEKKGLRYYLTYGTLLGAVKYSGFIPWDDDIDVMMPRPDYEKFLELTSGRLNESIDILTYKKTSNYIYPFAKAVNNKTILIEKDNDDYPLGVYMDIFPLDGVPEDGRKLKVLFTNIRLHRRFLEGSYLKIKRGKTPGSILIKAVVFPVCRILGSYLFLEKMNLSVTKYNFDDSKQVSPIVWSDRLASVNREKTTTPILLEFEGRYFSAPANYHEILTLLYGNYMESPPINKQVSKHDFKVFWK